MEPIMNAKPELTSTLAVLNEVTSNDLIMEEIIKNLDVPDLKNFRLVCSDWCWYRKSLVVWKKKAFVHIEIPLKNRCEKSTGKLKEEKPQDVVQFLKDTCDKEFRNFLGEHPFRSFSVTSSRVKSKVEAEEQEKVIENLWKVCGQFASHLQLKLPPTDSSDYKFHCLGPIARQLGPKVTTLEVVSMDLEMKDFLKVFLEGPAHPQVKRLELTLEYFSHFSFLMKFPNLEELKVSSWGTSVEDGKKYILATYVISTLRTIRFSKTKENVCNLRRLDMIESLSQDIGSLVEADLPLNYLTLRLGDGIAAPLNPLTFRKCMEHYSKSLKTLKLRASTEWNLTKPPGFPRKIDFRNLQVLEIWGYFVGNLNFLKGAPHLRRLRLDLICNELKRCGGNYSADMNDLVVEGARNIVENTGDIFDRNDFQLLELRELMLDFQLPEESWISLGRWMPNVRILGAPLDNTGFRLVCGQWPKLTELACRFGSDIDDDGLVGENGHDGVDARGQPTILGMKYLECFELEAACGQGKITDRSAEFGFLQMNYLRNLKASVSPHLVSEEMEMQLRAQIPHVEIIRNCRNENIPLKPSGNLICCNWAEERSRLQNNR